MNNKSNRSTNPDFDKKLGAKIRELRIANGLTREDLAKCLGVTHQQFQKYECGKNRLSAYALIPIANMLGVTPSYLLGQEVAELTGVRRAEILLVRAIKKLPPARKQALLDFKNILLREVK